MNDMKEDYYRLKSVIGDKVVTVTFSAYMDLEDLQDNLESFLLASGWHKDSLDKLFRNSEED